METEQHTVARGCGEHDTLGVYTLVLMPTVEKALMVTTRIGWFPVIYKERKL